uniref:Uncharacterized protein n=1 Tax=Rhizophora mucronata TaxID=61149 RepID=A0A2P2NNB9_RHIMU
MEELTHPLSFLTIFKFTFTLFHAIEGNFRELWKYIPQLKGLFLSPRRGVVYVELK